MASVLEQLWRCPPADRPAALAELPERWRAAARGLLDGPDVEGALVRGIRLAELRGDLPFDATVVELLHQGNYPARLLASVDLPLEGSLTAPDRAELLDRLREAAADLGDAAALARVRNREFLRLAWRELHGAALEEVGGGLSLLAEACVEFALERTVVRGLETPLREQVVVFAMGKLGGHELNFFSDIDLVFAHADEVGQGGNEIAATRARAGVHDALRAVVKLLEGGGEWRPLFRVDLRLRPFGSRGPLSLSVTATEAYYERHGRAWERQVWLRARAIAGRIDLGELLARRLTPFVHRRSLGPEVFEEVTAMMHRARREGRRVLDREATDLKLDPGCIREIEFFVQALQLLHAGRDLSLRTPSTLVALDRLAAAGRISDHEHRVLGEAYRWLRRVEHRVQLCDGRQTHSLPVAREELELLARRLAPADPTGEAFPVGVDEFRARLASHLARVRAVARTLAHDDDEQPALLESERQREWARSVVVDPGAPDAARIEALARLGVRDPGEASALLGHLFGREGGPYAAKEGARGGADRLLLACLDSSDPDAALRRLAQFAAHRPAHYAIWRFLTDEANDELARRVADLFGASEPLSRGLIGFPNDRGNADDGCVTLLQESALAVLIDRDGFERRWAEQRVPASTATDGSPDEIGDEREPLDVQLLRFKHRELVRIGLHDLGHRPDPLAVGASLSDLADLIVGEILADVARAGASRDSTVPPYSLAAFAVGKLGARAMDYGSDLDLIFVFEPAAGGPAAAVQHDAARAARAVIARLQAISRGSRLYEVDMRLRPSGRQGLLVSSLDGFAAYHRKLLPVWERIALLPLRAVAVASFSGPAGADPGAAVRLEGHLVHEVTRVIVPGTIYADDEAAYASLGAAMRQLRQRIEREVARETRDVYDVKSGRGGCLELELLCAALQLRAGRRDLSLRASRRPPELLARLGELGVLDASEVRALSSAYRFLRRLLNRLRMSHGPGTGGDGDRLVANSPRLDPIARRMGLVDQRSLISTYLAHRDQVREAFDRHLH